MTYGLCIRWRCVLACILWCVLFLPSSAQADRKAYLTGLPVERACQGPAAEGLVLSASPKVQEVICGFRGRCREIVAFNITFRCLNRVGTSRQTDFSLVDLFAFYHNDSDHFIYQQGQIGARATTNDGWHWLPRGYAPLPSGARFEFRDAAPRQTESVSQFVPLTPGLSAATAPQPRQTQSPAPQPPPKQIVEPAAWQVIVYNLSPYLQIGLGLLLTGLAALAYAGLRLDQTLTYEERRDFNKKVLWCAFYVGLGGLFFTVDLTGAIEEKRAMAGGVPIFLYVGVLLAILYFFVIALVHIVAGWHYLFVRHPATLAVSGAIASNSSINMHTLASSVMPSPSELSGLPTRPGVAYRAEAKRSRELADKLEADTQLVETAIARERLRARAADRKGD